MLAIVEIGVSLAVFDGSEWKSDDKILAAVLNSGMDPYGFSPSDPQPHITEAERVVKLFGGEILKADMVEHEPGLVY